MDIPGESTGKSKVAETKYIEVIKSDSIIERKYVTEDGLPTKIVYYCRECKKPVAPKRMGKKLSFSCSECKKEDISFGSEQSIENYYNVKVVQARATGSDTEKQK